MPIPLIAVAAIGGGVVLSAAAITYYYWPNIKKKLFGKTMLIMGPRGCGKTTIAHLLEHDRLPPEAKETKVHGKFKAKKLDLTDLDIDVELVNDMPGNMEARNPKWRPHFEKCDFAIYVLRSDLFLEGEKDHVSRVEQDVKSIKDWLGKHPRKIVFVASYSDKAPKQRKSISDAMAANADFKRIVSLIDSKYRRGPAVGSLASRESGKDLVFHALKEIEEI